MSGLNDPAFFAQLTEAGLRVTATMRQELGEGLRHPQAYLFARKP